MIMDIRIDSNLAANHTSYRLEIKDNLAFLTRIQAGWIRSKEFILEAEALFNELSQLSGHSIEKFAQSFKSISEETWAKLFDFAQNLQISCSVIAQTQHNPGFSGFVDCWRLTTEQSGFLLLTTSIFDHHNSNYHHDSCSHETKGEVSHEIMNKMLASNQNQFMELAEQFQEKDWKELHNSIPSAKDCTWLNEWRG